ncbi:hypothetical protein DFH28DRAFT_4033 [Melampsora americana]|nr:hypothetical protein DFH28DRAFT_4033 [Melampsora americana]
MPRAANLPRTTLTPAEKLTRTDDLMSDVLDACLWPVSSRLPNQIQNKKTIKFTPGYRRPRSLNINDIKAIISRVQSNDIKNISEATSLIRQIPAVMSYIGKGEPPRVGKHIGLYLQLFQPKCGIKFCETDRYDQQRRASDLSLNPSVISSTRASSCAASESVLSGVEIGEPSESNHFHGPTSDSIPGTPSMKQRGRHSRQSTSDPSASSSSKQRIHLAVFATRDYLVNDIVVGCEGSFADLTEEEDLRLRGLHPLDGHPDFSHLVNSRGKFQVFCGPARFVNHDCRNNVVLLREGFTIKFKVVQPIRADEEIVTSYGANYFGEANCECMCATCEQTGRGFYAEDPIASPRPFSPMCPPVNGVTCDESELSSVDALCASAVKDALSSPLSVKEESDRNQSPISTEQELSLRLVESDSLQDEIIQPEIPIRRGRGRPPSKRKVLPQALSKPAPTPETSQPKKTPASPSRSSSLRRHQSRSSLVKASLASAVERLGFVSKVRFTPTTDLTLPVLHIPGTSQHGEPCYDSEWVHDQTFDSISTSLPIVATAEQDGYKNIPSNQDELNEPAQVANLPKRKTYWITSKQRQLGLLPWDSGRAHKSEHRASLGHDNPRRYSSITPSLLGPSGSQRRQTTSFLPDHQLSQSEPPSGELRGSKKRAFSNSTTSPDAHLPKRSYWISTKEKQLGIVPWEPPPAEIKAKIAESQPRRSTRSAQKAIQGVQPFKGLPSAPRGSRLSFRVIESGTQEADLLGSAIGRELLGFRPTKSKKKTEEEPKDSTSKQSEHQDSVSPTRDQDRGQIQGISENMVKLSTKRKKTTTSGHPPRRGRKSKLSESGYNSQEESEGRVEHGEWCEEKDRRLKGGEADESKVEQTDDDDDDDDEGLDEYDLAGRILGSVIAIGSWSNPDSYRIQPSCRTSSSRSSEVKSLDSNLIKTSIQDITNQSSKINEPIKVNESLDIETQIHGEEVVKKKDERKGSEDRMNGLEGGVVVEAEEEEEEEEIDMLEERSVKEDELEDERCEREFIKGGKEDENQKLFQTSHHHHQQQQHQYHHQYHQSYQKTHPNLTSELSELDEC